MRCEITSDPAAFWHRAEDFLLARPVTTNVISTVVGSLLPDSDGERAPDLADTARFVTVSGGDGRVVGVAMRTPPYPALLSPMPEEAARALADGLWTADPGITAVFGPTETAAAFSGAWTGRSGRTARISERRRIFELTEVVPAAPVAGEWRRVDRGDRELVTGWHEKFLLETESLAVSDAARTIDGWTAAGRVFGWEAGGALVCYLAARAPVAGVVRIGPVYTPPEQRGRGYASALVAAASQRLLDEGASACTLHTDLANPTSNKIYAAVGYQPVIDMDEYAFG